MVFVKIAVLVLILALVFAFLLYQPLPEELDDGRLYQTLGVLTSLLNLFGKIPGTLFGWHFDLQRHLMRESMPKIHQNYPDLEVNDVKIEGVPVRVYKPKSLKAAAPAVVYLHGGGWVMHDIDTYDATVVFLALNTSMVVISVDYRLSPENAYPAAFEDCLQVTRHVLKNGHVYGIDGHRVAIAGDSAGGNLATAVAYKLAEEKSDAMPALKAQVLIYPVTQVFDFRTSSYLLYKNYPVQNQRYMATYVASYLLQDLSNEVVTAITENRHISSNIRHSVYKDYFKKENIPNGVRQNPDEEIEDAPDDNINEDIAKKMNLLAVDPYVSPLLAENLSQVPPAYVLVCEFDVLRDDGLLYVHRLRQAGVDVELTFAKNLPHSIMTFLASPRMRYKAIAPEWNKIYNYLTRNL